MTKPLKLDARRPTLYLDFDGVLHPENAVRDHKTGKIRVLEPQVPNAHLFMWANALSQAIQDSNIQVILSTSWVPVLGFDRALSYLPVGIKDKVAGATFHRHRMNRHNWMSFVPRHQQITMHVSRHNIHTWMALDDDVADWPAALDSHLIACDGAWGISKELHKVAQWVQQLNLYNNSSDEFSCNMGN